MAGESVALSISLADKLSGPALKAASSLAVLEKRLVKQRSISTTDSIKVSPIKSIGGPSAAEAKAAQKEAIIAQKAANKAKLAEEKSSQKALEKAAKDQAKAQVTKAKSAQKALEKAAKDEDKFQATVVKNRLKADAKVAKEQAALKKQQAKAAKEAYNSSIGGSFSNAFGEANKASNTFESLGTALGEVLNPATLAAAAIGGLAVALSGAILGGSALAIQASELKNDTIDALSAFLGTQKAAEQVYDQIGDITREVAISQSRATELARELSAAGVTSASALTDAIRSIGQVESVLGSEAGNKIQNVIERSLTSGKFSLSAKQLAGTGVQLQSVFSNIGAQLGIGNKEVEARLKAGKITAEVGVAALTKTLDTKFGATAGKQVLDLGSQVQRFKDNFSKLFEDVDTEGFLAGLQSVLDLFDQSTTSGQALHDTITSVFDSVFTIATDAIPYVRIGFKTLVLAGLEIYNAFRPVFAQFDLFNGASSDAGTFASVMQTVADAIGVVAGWFATLVGFKPLWYGLAAVVGLVVAAVGALAVGAALVVAPFFAVAAAIVLVLGYLTQLTMAALSAGADFVSGLVNGIKNGAGAVLGAVKGLASGAVDSFRNFFKMRSPSRLMMSLGDNITLGLAHGIDLGAPAVNDSLTNVVDPAVVTPARAAGGIGSLAPARSAAPSGSGKTFIFQAGAFQISISGVKDAEELEANLPGLLANVLEQASLQSGEGQKAA